ncbi:hypothetical protein [Haloprofundus salinisoli]|uniref:hypothetical protein n=1 Tax=Haloprofundus salinisoli TaxID=2876193 RepID=UPI001CCE6DB5|nr:hypothetical protein [Haloprofundus salinisoli]
MYNRIEELEAENERLIEQLDALGEIGAEKTTKTTNEIPDDLGLAGREVEYTDESVDVHRGTIRGTIVEDRDCTRVLLNLDTGDRVQMDRPSEQPEML